MNDEKIKQLTDKIIADMLTESTGTHFMDSGDAYGRHWEENQRNGIKTGSQPVFFYIDDDNKSCSISPIIPIFDFLSSTVEYTEECQMLESLLPHLNYDILHYIEDVIANPSNYDSTLQVFERNSLFDSKVTNSYNYDNTLSQVMLYVWFEYDCDDYIAISIHNGCDVRGGYTDIHIFKVNWAEEMHMAQFEANIQCKCGMHNYQQLDPNYIVYNNQYDNKLNDKFVYTHSYEDENGDLRCKYCNELIIGEMIDF